MTKKQWLGPAAVTTALVAVVAVGFLGPGAGEDEAEPPPRAARSATPTPRPTTTATATARRATQVPDLDRVVGRRGPEVPPGGRSPTSDKTQSKLWFHDGRWWGLLYDTRAGATLIHRLDPRRRVWVNTGVVVDGRDGARADALWDGHKLYVATGTTYESGWGSPPTARQVRAGSAVLQRFSYRPDRKTYVRDPGFPVRIHSGASESITLDEDSTGQLWVTYTRLRKVFVNRTTGGDRSWGRPFVLPGPAARVNSDDTSGVVAFAGGEVGVFWSNQNTRTFYFAVHDDAADDRAWRIEVAYGHHFSGCSRGCANDHMSLKALPDGRVFVAVKTANRVAGQPFIVLLVRSASGWAAHVAGTVEELYTRPLVVLSAEKRLVYLFMVVPEEGGAVYYKKSDVDHIEFGPGLGTPVLSGSGRINNPTSTKQVVDDRSGLVVLGSDGRHAPSGQAVKTRSRYWFNTVPVG
ncbi:hypothetical protein KRR39_02820 [Nocardioides panacis]|uniref:Uncharacterized protein n=1 Tax=Nocardioides panacis TaxID=2849501 RepID=A0A975SZS7_9ACTN|nr:hypothetical protein [Nocardioides panacis]QWZ08802.1 hypothetical protein KRR39_02820 [Nocardioides panacis]